ncbi:hypothetical protein PRIPAC_92136 [Pristionchus pacificus]|uniref:SCP domain-containing protein n=1 Tax=Pristionchus pacificus TaxID=54126 RepID=A0A2A6CDE3_PRIPA|nr:hypothetical protein PRIPAC_92136 [Pristionchus pacificus]|eukprot:PDM76063.1 hypothetical protein PRIPAC_39667 [Pristionchus pacificus]
MMIRAWLAIVLLASALYALQCPGGIPAAEVKAILKSHNVFRDNISKGKYIVKGKKMPAAKRKLPALKYDCGLETAAQAVASECRNVHSSNRHYVGENLWSKSASSEEYGWPSLTFTLDLFYSGVDHATQMAWQNTTAIGCGIALCNEKKWAIVACQYNITGNFLGAPIYVPKGGLV